MSNQLECQQLNFHNLRNWQAIAQKIFIPSSTRAPLLLVQGRAVL